jgi:hypothetical protein
MSGKMILRGIEFLLYSRHNKYVVIAAEAGILNEVLTNLINKSIVAFFEAQSKPSAPKNHYSLGHLFL